MIRRSRGPGLFAEHTPVMRNLIQRLRDLFSEHVDVSKQTYFTTIALFIALPAIGKYSLDTGGLSGCITAIMCTLLIVCSLIIVDSTLFKRS